MTKRDIKWTCWHETKHRGENGQKIGKPSGGSDSNKTYSNVNSEKESPKQQQQIKRKRWVREVRSPPKIHKK